MGHLLFEKNARSYMECGIRRIPGIMPPSEILTLAQIPLHVRNEAAVFMPSPLVRALVSLACQKASYHSDEKWNPNGYVPSPCRSQTYDLPTIDRMRVVGVTQFE